MPRLTPVVLTLLLAGCTVEESATPPPSAPLAGQPPAEPGTADPLKRAPQATDAGSPPPLLSARTADGESADSLAASGVRAAESDDLPAAARYFDRALEKDPKNRTALLSTAKVAQDLAAKSTRPYNSPMYLKAAGALRKLRETYPALTDEEKRLLPLALYNEACTLAFNGDLGRVVPVLADAYACGFEELAQIDLDPELDPVRKTPEFRRLVERMEREHVAKLAAAFTPFPFDFTLPDTDNKPVALADYKGKVVVVDFWGTWCPPCRKEIPHFAALLKAHKDQGLAVVGLNYEHADGETARAFVKKFARENGIPYPCLIGDAKTQALVPHLDAFPTTLVVDRGGTVRLRLTGYQPLGALEAAVAPLLAATGGNGDRPPPPPK